MRASNPTPTDESRAVSPVIGVILMVSITVILAAVIGTFALGVGEQSLETQPRIAMEMADADANYKPDAKSAFATLTHGGGDDLELGNTKIVVRNASDNGVVDTWDGSWNHGYFTSESLSSQSRISTSETIRLETTSDGANATITQNTEYTIAVVHKGSDTIVAQGTVMVR